MPILAVLFRRPSPRRLAGLLLLFLGALAPLPLRSQDVAAGMDLWITPDKPPAFIQLSIPAGFFNPGSLALLDLPIPLIGDPLRTLDGTPSLGRADTAVERLETAHLPFCGSSDTVALRIAALRLRGRDPVEVSYGAGIPHELWDVQACLSHAQQQMGKLTLHRQCETGGSFESVVWIKPKLIFKRRSDGLERVLDWIDHPDIIEEIKLLGSGGWVYQAPAGFPRITAAAGAVTDGDCDGNWDPSLPATTENFVVGLPPTSCICSGAQVPFSVGPVRHVDPRLENGVMHEHPVDPASEDSRAFPRTRDRKPETPEGKLQVFVPTLGFGALLAALVSWRRRRPGSKD